MTLKAQALTLIFATVLITSLQAKLADLDPPVHEAAITQANEFFLKGDIPSLRTLLNESHLFIKQDVALKLGRLGAKEALEELRQLDKTYANFACAESGHFGVAVVLIENPDKTQQRNALLQLATENRKSSKHADSLIDQAGRELSRYEGDDIELQLSEVSTYGAQFTVLTLQCRKLSSSDAIAKCIQVLEQHETPQKAEAAETILISMGKPATSPVQELKTRVEAKIKPSDPTFTIPKTIISRCEDILKKLSVTE